MDPADGPLCCGVDQDLPVALTTKLGVSGSDTPIFENYFAGGFSTLPGPPPDAAANPLAYPFRSYDGEVTYAPVAEATGTEYTELFDALAPV